MRESASSSASSSSKSSTKGLLGSCSLILLKHSWFYLLQSFESEKARPRRMSSSEAEGVPLIIPQMHRLTLPTGKAPKSIWIDFFSQSVPRIRFRALIYWVNASFVENESADEVKSSTSSTYSDHPPTLALSSSSDNLMSSKTALIQAYFYLRNKNWPLLSESPDEDIHVYANFMKEHDCYSLIPTSSKIVIFDTRLPVKKRLFCAGCKWVEGSAAMGLWSGSVCWHVDYFWLH